MNKTAYVVCRFQVVNGVPVFGDVGLYSEFPLSTMNVGWPQACLWQAEGRDFMDACQCAIAFLNDTPAFRWVVPLLRK